MPQTPWDLFLIECPHHLYSKPFSTVMQFIMLPDDINTVMSVTDSCSSTYLYATAPCIMRFQIGARTSPTVVMTWEVRCSSPFFDVCEVCLYLTVFLYLKHWQKASHQLIVTVQNKVIWLLLKIEFLLNNTGLILTCVWTEVPLSSAYLQIRWLRETRGRVFFYGSVDT